LTFARFWRGDFADGGSLNGSRVSGIFKMMGLVQNKISSARAGDVVALGRIEDVKAGDALSASGDAEAAPWPEPITPVYALAIHAGNRDDEVKMATAMAKIIEEDTSLVYGLTPTRPSRSFAARGRPISA